MTKFKGLSESVISTRLPMPGTGRQAAGRNLIFSIGCRIKISRFARNDKFRRLFTNWSFFTAQSKVLSFLRRQESITHWFCWIALTVSADASLRVTTCPALAGMTVRSIGYFFKIHRVRKNYGLLSFLDRHNLTYPVIIIKLNSRSTHKITAVPLDRLTHGF